MISNSRKTSKEEGNREFWASIKEPYDFIMNTHLIPGSFEVASDHLLSSCAEMELSWDSEDVSPHYVWSYSEFLDQYNELYEWLIQVQLQLYSHSNPPDINSRLDQQEELRRRIYRRNLFVEQGEKVAKKYPASEDEIKWRVNYLNNKWEQLQNTLTPAKGRTEEIAVELDLDHEEKLLRGWLGTMEGQIQPITCKLPRGCSLHALQERYKDNQILLKDIKAHGSILKSVVQQYERQAQSNEPDPTLEVSSKTTPDAKRSSYLLSPDVAADNRDKTTNKSSRVIPRRAKSLEKRYHQIYLRSLEWHYYLEGAIVEFKDQGSSCSSSESDDEPVSKCRRISKASLPSLPPQSVRRKPCSLGWSEYEANSSEAGSYIEDDYVMTSSEAYASRKVILEESNLLRKERVPGKICMDRQHPLSLMVATTVDQNNPVVKMNSCNNNNLSNVTTVHNFEPKLQSNNNNASDRENINLNQSPTTIGLKTVDRPSPNSGVFECKHNDTDSDSNIDEIIDTESKEIATEEIKNMTTPKRTISSYKISSNNKDVYEDEEMIQEDLQRIIDSAILDQDWLNSNITTTDSEGSIAEEIGEEHSIQPDNETPPSSSKQSYTPCNKQSIHRLVSYAEDLVREPLKVVKPHLKPLPLGMPNKQLQIKQWLYSQGNDAARFIGVNHVQDSCDASGELTTGESDDSDKEGFDTSLATEKGTSIYLHSSENTPTMEGSPLICLDEKKVKLRGKKRQRATQRPWSATDENQLLFSQIKVPAFELKDISNKTILSSSEPSLHSMERSPKTFQNQTYSHSYPKIWNSSWANSPDSLKSNIMIPSPTIVSDGINLSGTSSRTKDTDSAGYLRRKGKLRRRSNRHLLGIRTESGSDGIGSVSSRRKGGKLCTFSPYNSPTKSLSSESETVSGCPKPVKMFFSGDCGSQARPVMSSSTEKCLSDSSVASGVSLTSRTSKLNNNNNKNDDVSDSKKSNKIKILPSQPNHNSDQDASVHLEDASSLSEQAWDSYQEYKYLSEPYSEDLDVDAERKLLEFGDDYRNFIDSDGSSFNGLLYRSRRTTPRHRRMRMRRNSDSESDLEDLHHVISESKSQLCAMEKMLNSFVGEAAIGLDLEDVITATDANLKFLHDILKHLNREAPKMISEFSDLQSIVDRWGNVQAKALERQKQSAQFRQLQRQIKSLRLNMESVLSRCSSLTLSHTVENFAQLPKRVEDMKSLLCETEALRADLSGLNVIVHRFSTEMGPAFTPLKDEMAELYRLWDETHRRVNSELTHLQTVSTTCNLWEEQKLDLCKALKQDSEALKVIDAAIDSGKLTESVSASVRDVAKLLNEKRKLPGGKVKSQNLSVDQIELSKTDKNKKEDRLSDSGTSGYESCSSDDLSERERRLAYLRRLAKDLQSSLVPGTSAWNEVNATLDEAEKELKELQDHCRMLIMKTAETLEPNPKPSRFSSNCKRRNWVRENKSSRSPRSERRVRIAGNRRSSSSSSSWVWRVARAALPFQVALMLVLCVAYLLEPNCCDSVNTFNLSFTPQLRFVHGSPPV